MASLFDTLKQAAGTIGRDVEAPVVRGVRGAVQAINPFDSESAGNDLVNRVAARYETTPTFQRLLAQQNPTYGGTVMDNAELTRGGTAGGGAVGQFTPRQIRSPWSVSGIQISKGGDTDPENTLLHEGLHSVWDNTPQAHQQFLNAYNDSATPDLRSWLATQLSNYSDFKQAPSDSLMNLSNLPATLQNEVHSFIPEYMSSRRVALDNVSPTPGAPSLDDYYSQYFNPAAATGTVLKRSGVLNSIQRLLGSRM